MNLFLVCTDAVGTCTTEPAHLITASSACMFMNSLVTSEKEITDFNAVSTAATTMREVATKGTDHTATTCSSCAGRPAMLTRLMLYRLPLESGKLCPRCVPSTDTVSPSFSTRTFSHCTCNSTNKSRLDTCSSEYDEINGDFSYSYKLTS
jgi:hypothetical protein